MFTQRHLTTTNLIMISWLALTSCYNPLKSDIVHFDNMVTIITYDIPPNNIIDERIPLIKRHTIEEKVKQEYPGINHLDLIHCMSINDTVRYYEFFSQSGQGPLNLFVFEKNKQIVINAFRSDVKPDSDSRFKNDTNQVYVFKKYLINNSQFVVCIWFHYKDNKIYFSHDDKHSTWNR